MIELPQPILRLGIPMREKQIRERFRLDMRNPTLVPENVGAGTNRGLDLGWRPGWPFPRDTAGSTRARRPLRALSHHRVNGARSGRSNTKHRSSAEITIVTPVRFDPTSTTRQVTGCRTEGATRLLPGRHQVGAAPCGRPCCPHARSCVKRISEWLRLIRTGVVQSRSKVVECPRSDWDEAARQGAG